MLIARLSAGQSLLLRPLAGLYIYLRDHNKHINPEASKLKVSYRNPANLGAEAPLQPTVEYPLAADMQTLLDRQIFEEYKTKLLRGIIDQEQ
jgi:hypothetical protein